jgi:hypothetical protein
LGKEGFSNKPLQPREITAPFAALFLVTWAGTLYCVILPPVLMYMLAFVSLVGVTNCRSEHAWHRSGDSAESFRSSTATSNLQKDSNHKSSSMWRIANACRLCAPACRPSQGQTSSNKATTSTYATLSYCTYANVRQSCCHGTLNPSRVRFIQQVGNKVKCCHAVLRMGHRWENHFLAPRYLTGAP